MNSLNLNVYNVIIVLGILHGLIFSIVLLINPKFKSKTNSYLALTILSLCFSNLQYLLYDIGIIGAFYAEYLFIPFEFLILPMFYLFVRSYLNIAFKAKLIYLLAIPFVLTVLHQLIINLFNINTSAKNLLNLIFEYGALCFSVILIILIFQMIVRYKKSLLQIEHSVIPKTTSWLKRLLILGLILCIVWFFSLNIFKDYMDKGLYPFYPLWIGISILVYWIAYSSIFQTNIYNDRKAIRNTKINEKIAEKENKIKPSDNKFNEVHKLITGNKLFLNPKLSLHTLSKEIGISGGYLSQIINSNSGKNYNDYINELRVEYVKRMLTNEEYSNYTITAIGLESGFNTKTSFYSIFKKFTGKTPNQYKKLVQNL